MRWFGGALGVAIVAVAWGCTAENDTIDPGSNFVIPLSIFNADYFYCHVEPQYLFNTQTMCGAGQTTDNGNCHFNSSAVSGMTLQDHPLIDCGGGDHPADDPAGTGSIGPGSAANNNFSSASLEMSRDCSDYNSCQAAILKRPTSTNAHPRQIFPPTDPNLPTIIFTWASTP
jgi:hypothetical protein